VGGIDLRVFFAEQEEKGEKGYSAQSGPNTK
jgi:hypothetical protein